MDAPKKSGVNLIVPSCGPTVRHREAESSGTAANRRSRRIDTSVGVWLRPNPRVRRMALCLTAGEASACSSARRMPRKGTAIEEPVRSEASQRLGVPRLFTHRAQKILRSRSRVLNESVRRQETLRVGGFVQVASRLPTCGIGPVILGFHRRGSRRST